MHNVVPGPMKVMKWIEKEVAKKIKRGIKDGGMVALEWETPSKFKVYQKLQRRDTQTIKLQLLGRCEIEMSKDLDKVSITRHKAATAPNLIHSLDASLIQMSVVKFDAPIATIHDSVLTRATDMTRLSELVRETYKELFADNNYLIKFAQDLGAETEPPIEGDLEPSDVIESTYFFC